MNKINKFKNKMSSLINNNYNEETHSIIIIKIHYKKNTSKNK